jgi:hypothetical protein
MFTCTLLLVPLQLYIGNLTPGAVTDAMLSQVFDSALIAAFPQAAAPGQEPVCRVRRGAGLLQGVGFWAAAVQGVHGGSVPAGSSASLAAAMLPG